MAVVPLAVRSAPLDVLASLADEPGAALVAVPDPHRPATLVGCAPVAELRVDAGNGGDALAALERFVADTHAAEPTLPFPLAGGVIVALAYELGTRHPGPADVPLLLARRYDPLLVFEHAPARWTLVASDAHRTRPRWLERLGAPTPRWHGPLARAPLTAALDAAAHRSAVVRILEYLAAGDAYQVNLTQPFTAPLAAPAWALFAELATRHPVPHSAYLDAGGAQILMNSPELLLRRRGRRVETRPIKGTRPRGADPARDAALACELANDEKERAEHVMIVDLERNDLGRVCEVGSVAVETLAAVASHPTVHHLVSAVSGRLVPGTGLAALLGATFPGGSVTGAPKERAMEIIAELEPSPRGIYTGALGVLDPRGDLELGLPIRTAVVSGGTVRWHAGGGIVADSDPERELAEAWLKTAALRIALGEHEVRCSSG
jgi:para-aminobenzoate synthetase component 1